MVDFTVTIINLGTTIANDVVIYDSLPLGYQLANTIVTQGVFNPISNEWTIPFINPNQSEALNMTALVMSSNNLLNVALLQSLNETD